MKSGLPKEVVFLTQTDTTVGFVSQNADELTRIKRRSQHKHYIKAVCSLQTLKEFTRIPNMHKKRVRRSDRITFILPDGHSYRIIRDPRHRLLLDRLKWVYTTSANLSEHTYDETFAKEAADIIITPLCGQKSPSQIIKLGKKRSRRVR